MSRIKPFADKAGCGVLVDVAVGRGVLVGCEAAVGDGVSVGVGVLDDISVTVGDGLKVLVDTAVAVGELVIVASGIEVSAGEKFSAPTAKIAMMKSTISPPPHIQADPCLDPDVVTGMDIWGLSPAILDNLF
jgi:UDP-3-O-[3-hydroxymyristoyl] glucosamine N-acyltransferase